MTYAEVVEKAKADVSGRTKYGNHVVKYKPCVTWLNGDQINLWSYWQGFQIKNIDSGVDILLVGQDWGNPDRNPDVIKRIEQIQQGDTSESYLATVSPTDKNLIEMFRELDCDITKRDPGRRVFFTNYSLGYRSGSETGGMTLDLMHEDRDLFHDLVDAIKPKLIICLGKMTYEAVIEKSVYGFVNTLKKGTPFRVSLPGHNSITVYGVPHCGARGVNNIGGKDVMHHVWRYIAEKECK